MLTEFDESLWLEIVDKLNVHSDDGFMFVLNDGNEVMWYLTR